MDETAIQAALLTKLKTDSGVQAVLGTSPNTRIYDDITGLSPVMPYVTLGEMITSPFDTCSSTGLDSELAIHVWSGYRGKKEAQTILSAIRAALHRQDLVVSGNSTVLMEVFQCMTALDEDGLTRHGIARVRVIYE